MHGNRFPVLVTVLVSKTLLCIMYCVVPLIFTYYYFSSLDTLRGCSVVSNVRRLILSPKGVQSSRSLTTLEVQTSVGCIGESHRRSLTTEVE